jgi:lysophospholipase L1-like esterase
MSEARPEERPFTVVVWGDSIAAGTPTHCWLNVAETACNQVVSTGRAVQFINEATGGMPAARARDQFEARVLRHTPDAVIIQFGFNDIRHDGSRGALPLSTPEEFQEHLTHMVARCRQETKARVILFGNHRTRVLLHMPTGETYEATRTRYNDIIRRVAEAAGVPYYDMSEELLQVPGTEWRDLVNEDGVHLSMEGDMAYGRFAASVISKLILDLNEPRA